MRSPIGRRVRLRRMQLGFQQSELARRVGCSPAAISYIEHGKVHRSRFLVEIADVLRCSAHWLAGVPGSRAPVVPVKERSRSRRETAAQAVDRILDRRKKNAAERLPWRERWRAKLPRRRRA